MNNRFPKVAGVFRDGMGASLLGAVWYALLGIFGATLAGKEGFPAVYEILFFVVGFGGIGVVASSMKPWWTSGRAAFLIGAVSSTPASGMGILAFSKVPGEPMTIGKMFFVAGVVALVGGIVGFSWWEGEHIRQIRRSQRDAALFVLPAMTGN